jgi:hypothetical protein
MVLAAPAFFRRHPLKGPMDCTICGKPSLPGAMLCAPCKAALKRARYVTVQEDMRPSSVIDVRRKPRHARSPGPAAAPRSAPEAVPPQKRAGFPPPTVSPSPDVRLGRRIFIGIFVVASAMGGASYFGQRELGAHPGDTASVPEVPASEPVRDPAGGVTEPRKEEAALPPTPVAARVAVPQTQPAPAAAVPAKRVKPSARAAVATAYEPFEGPNVVREPEKVAAAPAPALPPPPVPDRWQNMRDAQAQCDREGLLSGLICGQRVRMQYCDGYWGKVAQCQGANVPYDR